MRDFTVSAPVPSGSSSHWVVGNKYLAHNNTYFNTQSVGSSWNTAYTVTPGQVITIQLVYLGSSSVTTAGMPVRRVLIERLGGCRDSSSSGFTSAGDSASGGGGSSGGGSVGVVALSSTNPTSQLVAQGGGGTIGTATSLGLICPPNMSAHNADEVGGFATFLYVGTEHQNAGTTVWNIRDPVNVLADSCYADYLHLNIDSFFLLGYCGLGQPFSAWRHVIDLPEPIIIGSGQSLNLGITCAQTDPNLDSFQVFLFVRALIRALE